MRIERQSVWVMSSVNQRLIKAPVHVCVMLRAREQGWEAEEWCQPPFESEALPCYLVPIGTAMHGSLIISKGYQSCALEFHICQLCLRLD